MFGVLEYKKRLQAARAELCNIVTEMDAIVADGVVVRSDIAKQLSPEIVRIAAAARSMAHILVRVIDSLPGEDK